MPHDGKSQNNAKMLEEIYASGAAKTAPEGITKAKGTIFSRFSAATVKQYFSDPKVVDRWIAGSILFFGLAAVVFGTIQFRGQLSGYFKINPVDIGLSEETNQAEPDLLGLREKDTDLDTISDYDELNVYGTSPYLPDTDSDGLADSAEIAAGTDPACPKGQQCFATWNSAPAADQAGTSEDELLLRGQITGPQLRQLLLDAGAPKAEIDKLTDAQLLQQYQQLVAEAGEGAAIAPETINVQGSIEDLTPAEIRELLIQRGLDPNVVNSISDAELLDLVNEAVTEL